MHCQSTISEDVFDIVFLALAWANRSHCFYSMFPVFIANAYNLLRSWFEHKLVLLLLLINWIAYYIGFYETV